MNFGEALEILNAGGAVRLPEWKGYWFKSSGIIKVRTAKAETLDTPDFQQYIFRADWEQVKSLSYHLKREAEDLEQKIASLTKLITEADAAGITVLHHDLLKIQLVHMNNYLSVLEEQINDLKKK
jgi:hypothetical protein